MAGGVKPPLHNRKINRRQELSLQTLIVCSVLTFHSAPLMLFVFKRSAVLVECSHVCCYEASHFRTKLLRVATEWCFHNHGFQ